MTHPKMILFDYGDTLLYKFGWRSMWENKELLKHAAKNENNLKTADIQKHEAIVLGRKTNKLMEQAPLLYFSYLALLTILFIVLLRFDYKFIVYHKLMWFVLQILIEGALTAICAAKRYYATKAANAVSQLLPLLSLIFLCATGFILDGAGVPLAMLHAAFCFFSCFFVSYLYSKISILGDVGAVLNILLLLLFIVAAFFIMTFGQIGQNTVVLETSSPNQLYTAVMIDSDEGALGGNTIIVVQHNASERNIWLGRFIKITRIYTGKGQEFDAANLEWQDDDTLLFRRKAYSMAPYSAN